MRFVAFDVVGVPAPQAGMRAVTTPRGARLITAGGTNLKEWRSAVANSARDMAEDGMLIGPVRVDVVFRFPMPESRPKRLRAFGCYKIGAPDADKLARSLGDALTAGGLIEDDARIVEWRIKKVEVWQSWTGAQIRVTQLDLVPATKPPGRSGYDLTGTTTVGVK